MSGVVSHLATGASLGVVMVLLAGRAQPLTRLGSGVIVLWVAILAVLPDAEMLFGRHRDLFTNVWALVVLPPAVVAYASLQPWARTPALRAILLAAPAALASHLWHDTFGFSNRYAKLLWPFSETTFIGAPPRLVRGLDGGSVLLVALLWLLVVMVVWTLAMHKADRSPRRVYALAALLVVANALPLLVVLATGLLHIQ